MGCDMMRYDPIKTTNALTPISLFPTSRYEKTYCGTSALKIPQVLRTFCSYPVKIYEVGRDGAQIFNVVCFGVLQAFSLLLRYFVQIFIFQSLSISLFRNLLFEADSYSNEYLLAKCGVDTAENGPLKVCEKLARS